MSGDKTKCEANQCSCTNGVGSSGAKCLIDGDPKCESCNAGFKLASDSKSCSGMSIRLHVVITDCCHAYAPTLAFENYIVRQFATAMTTIFLLLSACSISNAKTYSKGCEVSSCDAGWKVSGDRSKCEANRCLCTNGVGSSGAKCLIDGDPKCESCKAGFKLASDIKSCSGTCTTLHLILTDAKLVFYPPLAYSTHIGCHFIPV